MYDTGREQRIGSALRQMAEDLVKERRRVLELRRENRRLRADLERLKNAQAPTDVAAVGNGRSGPPSPSPIPEDAGGPARHDDAG